MTEQLRLNLKDLADRSMQRLVNTDAQGFYGFVLSDQHAHSVHWMHITKSIVDTLVEDGFLNLEKTA